MIYDSSSSSPYVSPPKHSVRDRGRYQSPDHQVYGQTAITKPERIESVCSFRAFARPHGTHGGRACRKYEET
jgi:hypothetical protein